MIVIQIPENPVDAAPATGDDVLVNRHAVVAGVQDALPELAAARRRVVVALARADDCMTIAALREALPDIDHLVTMLLGELQADGIVDRHLHDGSRDMHYFLTPDGDRYSRAN